jgi:Ser/Thr protein kinase RdoA (MazF antagonist)
MPSSDTRQDYGNDLILREIFGEFVTDGRFLKGYPFGSGHIHDTYLIETDGPDNYILQKLNNTVFRRIPEMQENIERVTGHIRDKLLKIDGSDLKRACLNFLKDKSGKTWITDNTGAYWRLSIFIRDHRSYDLIDSPEKAFEGGRAIGRFQAMVADLPGEPLHESIPDFHHAGKRIETFFAAINADRVGRVKGVREEIDFLSERAEKMKVILKLGRENKIPLRITHNDTKFNNILLDNNDKALCLIDLDTVMPGYVMYDFGDAIRTGANTASEDETDISRIKINMELYKSFAAGYLSEAVAILNKTELEYLAFGPLLLTYTQTVRFLTDYIDGDRYYKIHHEKHNLQRTRAQLQLLRSMEEHYGEMKQIVSSLT